MLAFPPVVRGQAEAGEDPGLGVTVAAADADALGRAVAVAVGAVEADAVGLAEREADAVAVAVGEEPTSAWGPHALTTTMPRAKAKAP